MGNNQENVEVTYGETGKVFNLNVNSIVCDVPGSMLSRLKMQPKETVSPKLPKHKQSRGTTQALNDAFDIVLGFSLPHARKMCLKKVLGNEKKNTTDLRWRHRNYVRDNNSQRILVFMLRNPYAKKKDVAEATGLHRCTVYWHLKNLHRVAEEARANA